MHEPPDVSLPDELVLQARKALGTRLRDLRKARDLKQWQVAGYAGTNQAAWSRLENGKVDARLSWLLRAQRLFEADSLETLFGPAPSRRAVGENDSSDGDGGRSGGEPNARALPTTRPRPRLRRELGGA
jgi:transcriptional regulator with XRE-family HTH domain